MVKNRLISSNKVYNECEISEKNDCVYTTSSTISL